MYAMNGKTILKYVLDLDNPAIDVPKDAKFLSVQVQESQPVVWFEVDPRKPKEKRRLAIVGTGWDNSVYPNYEYLGTFQVMGGALIFHLYEILALA